MTDETHFRRVMGHFTTGVTLVTSRGPGDDPCGLTANAFSSVSLDPPLVLVCLDRTSETFGQLVEREAFAVSVLGAEDRALARRFSEGDRGSRFAGLEVRREVTGSPVVERALAWVDCRLRDVHRAGDHSIVVGEVVACGAREGRPLLFFRGAYEEIGP